jgi:4-carboxymuconolactone decarboxylase
MKLPYQTGLAPKTTNDGYGAKGTAPSQLRFHIEGGLQAGLPEAEIVEIMLLISVYAGSPAAFNGILAAYEVANSMKEK